MLCKCERRIGGLARKHKAQSTRNSRPIRGYWHRRMFSSSSGTREWSLLGTWMSIEVGRLLSGLANTLARTRCHSVAPHTQTMPAAAAGNSLDGVQA